ncbi:MAG: hypothetical protein RRC34_10570 [Lentisphaeria bacterium]|nr:hypothetical protein [Lentisphaeria bacterium]
MNTYFQHIPWRGADDRQRVIRTARRSIAIGSCRLLSTAIDRILSGGAGGGGWSPPFSG